MTHLKHNLPSSVRNGDKGEPAEDLPLVTRMRRAIPNEVPVLLLGARRPWIRDPARDR